MISTTGNVYQGCVLTTLFPSPIIPELPLPKLSALPFKIPRIIFRRVSEVVGEKDGTSTPRSLLKLCTAVLNQPRIVLYNRRC